MIRAASILAVVSLAAGAAPKDSCTDCHSALPAELGAPAGVFAKDIHSRRGLFCTDCHGGDRTSDDPAVAMSPAHGFRGRIARTVVPKLCARCHADENVMRRYNPRERTDQYAQYQTSVHGKRIAAGDDAAATCIDCHSVHDIREVKDPLSPVHPLRLPGTCATCHADAARMAKYKIPVSQFADYRQSVHWEALSKDRDAAAPNCASCHGNHGATPPQVSSVAAVCGTCHAMMEDLYRTSPHAPAFASMEKGGCVVCHSNHAVHRPSTAMLVGPKAVCADCHSPADEGGKAAAGMAALITKLSDSLDGSDEVLARARRSGMEVSEALLKQHDGREALVKARVAVHTFRTAAVRKAADEGLAIAGETRHAGEQALRDRDFRRLGLGIALIAIALTIVGLRLAIRSLEGEKQPAGDGSGR
jgi:hypothetical protein